MSKNKKSPQEKKTISYSRDRRNTYGERGSHSRFAIAAQKTINRRVTRHRQDQVIRNLRNKPEEALESVDYIVKTTKQRNWKKAPDTPLGMVVGAKLTRRIASVGAKQQRRARTTDTSGVPSPGQLRIDWGEGFADAHVIITVNGVRVLYKRILATDLPCFDLVPIPKDADVVAFKIQSPDLRLQSIDRSLKVSRTNHIALEYNAEEKRVFMKRWNRISS